MLRKILLPFLLLSLTTIATSQQERHFTFHYAFTVKDLTAGQPVRVWIPAAHSDQFQEVKVLSATGDLPLKQKRESKYGNEMYYAESPKNAKPELHFEVVYDIVRHEHLTLGLSIPHLTTVKLSDKERKQ